MVQEPVLTRVGIISHATKSWMGGLNYLVNLLRAVKSVPDQKIEIIIFVGKKSSEEIKNMLRPFATIVEDSIFDRGSFNWLVHKILVRFFNSNMLLERVLLENRVRILSHSGIFGLKKIKCFNWIADFQHLHLPQLFSETEIESRKTTIKLMAEKSDGIILSSKSAYQDFVQLHLDFSKRAKVLQFVSPPPKEYAQLSSSDESDLREKYKISGEFFYLPNQFWAHKNHITVFAAVKKLLDQGIHVQVVCTGLMEDYRNKDHMQTLNDFIQENKIDQNIRLLGLVDYSDVYRLIKFSKAVINPSLFEGWSSTVEECKSVGKSMILSDIPVHREQYPEVTFFKKDDIDSLVIAIKNFHMNKVDRYLDYESRQIEFGQKFVAILTN